MKLDKTLLLQKLLNFLSVHIPLKFSNSVTIEDYCYLTMLLL